MQERVSKAASAPLPFPSPPIRRAPHDLGAPCLPLHGWTNFPYPLLSRPPPAAPSCLRPLAPPSPPPPTDGCAIVAAALAGRPGHGTQQAPSGEGATVAAYALAVMPPQPGLPPPSATAAAGATLAVSSASCPKGAETSAEAGAERAKVEVSGNMGRTGSDGRMRLVRSLYRPRRPRILRAVLARCHHIHEQAFAHLQWQHGSRCWAATRAGCEG